MHLRVEDGVAAWTACTDDRGTTYWIARVLMPGQKALEEHRRRNVLSAVYDVAVRHGIEALTVRAVAAAGIHQHLEAVCPCISSARAATGSTGRRLVSSTARPSTPARCRRLC